MSHLIEMSNITTRANNQFPRPDFHRLDKQPYRLQPLSKGDAVSSKVAPQRGMKDRWKSPYERVAAYTAACLTGESPVSGIGCLPE